MKLQELGNFIYDLLGFIDDVAADDVAVDAVDDELDAVVEFVVAGGQHCKKKIKI